MFYEMDIASIRLLFKYTLIRINMASRSSMHPQNNIQNSIAYNLFNKQLTYFVWNQPLHEHVWINLIVKTY